MTRRTETLLGVLLLAALPAGTILAALLTRSLP